MIIPRVCPELNAEEKNKKKKKKKKKKKNRLGFEYSIHRYGFKPTCLYHHHPFAENTTRLDPLRLTG